MGEVIEFPRNPEKHVPPEGVKNMPEGEVMRGRFGSKEELKERINLNPEEVLRLKEKILSMDYDQYDPSEILKITTKYYRAYEEKSTEYLVGLINSSIDAEWDSDPDEYFVIVTILGSRGVSL